MAVTRLKRKEKRNKNVAKSKVAAIKQLTAMPVIKNVDIEELKSRFTTVQPKAAKASKKQEEAAPEAAAAADTPEA